MKLIRSILNPHDIEDGYVGALILHREDIECLYQIMVKNENLGAQPSWQLYYILKELRDAGLAKEMK